MKLQAISYKLKARTGFTIVETLLVVGIITLMLSITLVYTQRGGKQVVLFREHAALVQQLLRARNLATEKYRPGTERINGYGLNILNSTTYELFKELDYPGSGSYGKPTNSAGKNEILEKFQIDSQNRGVLLKDYTNFPVMFPSVGSRVYFKGEVANPGEEANVSLELDNGERVTIYINYDGAIYTQ